MKLSDRAAGARLNLPDVRFWVLNDTREVVPRGGREAEPRAPFMSICKEGRDGTLEGVRQGPLKVSGGIGKAGRWILGTGHIFRAPALQSLRLRNWAQISDMEPWPDIQQRLARRCPYWRRIPHSRRSSRCVL